jgi:hypothetical protein
VTIGLGAGYGTSALHDDASGPTWEGALRLRQNDWFGIEIGVGSLHTTTTRSSPNVTSTTRRRTDSVGFNALVMPAFGRVTVSGGGGLSLGVFHRTYTQAGFTNQHTGSALGVQALGGVDVAISSRWAAYGVARLAVLDGYVERSIAGGVRFALATR